MHTIGIFKNAQDVVEYPAGTRIFTAGEVGDVMYAVINGEVDIVVGGDVVETVGEGGILGEMALIDQAPRSADAMAKTDSTLARVEAKEFTYLVQQHPTFALHVMRVMAARLRHLDAEHDHR